MSESTPRESGRTRLGELSSFCWGSAPYCWPLARTADVEEDLRSSAAALGAADTQVVVTFSTIAISITVGEELEPLTVMRMVHRRRSNYASLAAAFSLARAISLGLGLDEAGERLANVSSIRSPYPRTAVFLAAGLSAAAITMLLGGGPIDALATGLAAIVVGFVGGYFARRGGAPTALWVVPASLPLLPGLLLLQGLVAMGESNDASSIVSAGIVAFTLGVGVAGGDLMALAAHRFEHRVVRPIVEPAAQALYAGVDIISGLRTTRGRRGDGGSDEE